MPQMVTIGEMYGEEQQLLSRVISQVGFSVHVSLPGIVQKYDPRTQTAEIQPSIREKVIREDGKISYIEYPLLINVPVAFPQAGGFSITFPIKQGDECIVLFSDLAIDNWWLKGSVQNPVEQRRHDLSDGMAILGLSNQEKLKEIVFPPEENALVINDEVRGANITLYQGGGSITSIVSRSSPGGGTPSERLETVSFAQLIKQVYPDST